MTEIQKLAPGHKGGGPDGDRIVGVAIQGDILAIGCRDRKISIWDVNTGAFRFAMTLPANNNAISAIRMPSTLKTAEGEQILVAGDESGNVALWNAVTGVLVKKLDQTFGYGVMGLDISADGKTMVVCASGANIYVWDLNPTDGGSLRYATKNLSEELSNQVAVTPDGSRMMLADRAGRFSVWSTALPDTAEPGVGPVAPDKLIQLNKDYKFQALNPIAVSPCGKFAAVEGVPSIMYIVDIEQCSIVKELDGNKLADGHHCDEIIWSADGKTLFATYHRIGGPGSVREWSRIWSDAGNVESHLLGKFEVDDVHHLAIRPSDGALIVGGVGSKTTFNTALIKNAGQAKGDLPVEDFTCAPAGAKYITGDPSTGGFVLSSDSSVCVVNTKGTPTCNFKVDSHDGIDKMSASPDGKLLASYSGRGFFVNSLADGKEVWSTREVVTDYIWGMCWAPDSAHILLGTEAKKNSIVLVNVLEKVVVWTIEKAHKEMPQALAVNAQGTHFFSGGDKIGKLWAFSTSPDAAPTEPLKEFKGHSDSIRAAKFLPAKEGKDFVVSGDLDAHVYIWDMDSGEKVTSFKEIVDHDVKDIDVLQTATGDGQTTYIAICDDKGTLLVKKQQASDEPGEWETVVNKTVTSSSRQGAHALSFRRGVEPATPEVAVAGVGLCSVFQL